MRFLIVIAVLFFAPLPSAAQVKWSGEAEFIQTQKGHQEYSLYVFTNAKKVDVLSRYTLVEGTLNRGEFAIGKTISASDRLIVIPYGGLTTDGAVFTPTVVVIKIEGRHVVYTLDPKIYLSRKNNTLYQKLSVGFDRKELWQLRWEDLRAGNFHVFSRFGIEKRFQTGKQTHLFAAGFYDPINKSAGVYAGLRSQ
jgi:hypothetical protein